jgi:hypothetical protein
VSVIYLYYIVESRERGRDERVSGLPPLHQDRMKSIGIVCFLGQKSDYTSWREFTSSALGWTSSSWIEDSSFR